eukprot:TRINITY_DN29471_c0_g4_i1.p1 TRINITY_DN29471_c0_g4~~TRINITY_DN29471_c0_g4_i1.p1  ORF type:complete len:427 (-),score=84.60 TRINITY_DN29471_c0_g4_i1:59-1339(-)
MEQTLPSPPDASDDDAKGSAAMAEMLSNYFKDSGMTLQEYFKFPEMKQIKNPVHEYFRLGNEATMGWLEEGTLAIEEGDEGWMLLGAEHLELARIAVKGSGNRHYQARPWEGSYAGPLLRTTAAGFRAGAFLVGGAAGLSGKLVLSALSIIYTPSPHVPPYDAPLEDRFVEESIEVDGDTWYFRVWLPPDIHRIRKEQQGLPVFMLLHGFKECGWDNYYQMNAGLALKLQSWSWAKWFPGILVLPQLPRRPWSEQWWEHWRAPAMQRIAMACLQKAVAKYRGDASRIYLLGESLGTEGAWYLAAANPGQFAAVAGACGSVEPYDWNDFCWAEEPERFQKLADGIGRDTPMWFCHGAQDDFVPPEQSRRMHAALQKTRGSSTFGAILGRSEAAKVVYKEYEDLDHHVWDRAYDEDGVIEWLLEQRKH